MDIMIYDRVYIVNQHIPSLQRRYEQLKREYVKFALMQNENTITYGDQQKYMNKINLVNHILSELTFLKTITMSYIVAHQQHNDKNISFIKKETIEVQNAILEEIAETQQQIKNM